MALVSAFNNTLLDMIDNFDVGRSAKFMVKSRMDSDEFIEQFIDEVDTKKLRNRDPTMLKYNGMDKYLTSDDHVRIAWKYLDVLLEIAEEHRSSAKRR